MSNPNPGPSVGPNKAIAAGVGGSAATIIIWVLGQFGIQMPPEVAAAATGLISTALAYYVPHGGTP